MRLVCQKYQIILRKALFINKNRKKYQWKNIKLISKVLLEFQDIALEVI